MHTRQQRFRAVFCHCVARRFDSAQKFLDGDRVLTGHIQLRDFGKLFVRQRDLRDAALVVLLDGKDIFLNAERDLAVFSGIQYQLQALDRYDNLFLKELRHKACFFGRELIGDAQIR